MVITFKIYNYTFELLIPNEIKYPLINNNNY